MGRLFHEQVAKDQPLDLGAQKAADGILRAADDRFLYIEGGVEKHRHAGESAECREKIIESGIGLSRHRLDARRPIHMGHGGNDPFRGRLDPHRKLHKGGSGRNRKTPGLAPRVPMAQRVEKVRGISLCY